MVSGRSNKLTGQIGEFLVSAEMGKRGLIATPFAGNVPKFDIIVADEHGRSIPVQVKSSNHDTWPSRADLWMDITIDDDNKCQILNGEPRLDDSNLIFVCVRISTEPNTRDRYFILRKADLQQVCVKEYTNWMDSKDWKRPRNYKSLDCRYSIHTLEPFENNWDIIFQSLSAFPRVF